MNIISYLFLFTGLFILGSCVDSSLEENPQQLISMTEWNVHVDFPNTGSSIDTLRPAHPDFPESQLTQYIMEGYKDSSYFMFFVSESTLNKEQRNSVKLFAQGYYELLESILNGGISNHPATNIRFEIEDCDSIYGMTATANYFGFPGDHHIVMKAYTNGYQLIVLGVVACEKDIHEQNAFFKSLTITVNPQTTRQTP